MTKILITLFILVSLYNFKMLLLLFFVIYFFLM